MILGSHNSWSFMPPKKWWQKALAFTARCQRKDIQEQYALGVRCFDLRLRYKDGTMYVVHNSFVYCKLNDIEKDLVWLDSRGDVVVRVIHDVRKGSDWTKDTIHEFSQCCILLDTFFNMKFWCGRNLYNWEVDYEFDYKPRCTEMYSSVCSPRIIDDWFPLIYAKRNNSWIRREEYKENEILLIDFIDIK